MQRRRRCAGRPQLQGRFPVVRQIGYISTFTALIPGGIIVTGTPTGSGARPDPPVYLKPGDRIDVEAKDIGILQNSVVDE